MYQEMLEKYFEKNEEKLLDAVCRLVRINSVKGEAEPGKPFGRGPAAALAEALQIAEDIGFPVKNYDNYAGAVDFNDKEHQLDILAHLDVVPADNDWTVTQPFDPIIKDGCLYGRGSADDKGPAMAALFAMKAVRDLGIPLKKNVRLILGTDEEDGSSDIAYYYAREKEAPMTFSPDADYPVIHIEKGGLQPTFWAKWEADEELPCVRRVDAGLKGNMIPGAATAEIEGFARETVERLAEKCGEETGVAFSVQSIEDGVLRISAAGLGAHASLPEDGKNALTAMLELLTQLPAADSQGFRKLKALHQMFPHGDWLGKAAGVAMHDELSGDLTICLDILHYERGSLSGMFDCRAPLCATNENVRDVVKVKLADAGIELENRAMSAPHYVPADSPLVTALMKCYEQYTGRKEKPLAIGGGTYVHGLQNGVAFGCAMPGTNNRMHGADEFAVVEDLVVSAKIFAQAIIDLCS